MKGYVQILGTATVGMFTQHKHNKQHIIIIYDIHKCINDIKQQYIISAAQCHNTRTQRREFNPSRNTQHATRNTQHATRSTQHATRNTQHAARSTQHAARSTQHAARSTQHAARSTQHAVHPSSLITQNHYPSMHSPAHNLHHQPNIVADSTSSLLVFFDNQRYLFDVGEGTQRFCLEHSISFSFFSSLFWFWWCVCFPL